MALDVQPKKADASLGDLFSELSGQTTALVRQEMNLAKTEMGQKVSQLGKDLVSLAAGGAVAYAGLLAIIAGVIEGLGHYTHHPAITAVVVGVVIAAIGGMLVMKGMKAMKNMDLAPRNTIDSLKEDAKWAKEQTK